jgi:hypothetical protein
MKKHNLVIALTMAMLLPLLITPTMFKYSAFTNPDTLVKVQPVENIFYTNTTSVGHTFKISIMAQDVASPGFYGWQLVLSWTPGLINCTLETINYAIWPTFLGPWVPVPIDNINGKYEQSLTGRSPSVPRTGTWWLVNLTFQIIQAPLEGHTLQTSLTISPGAGSDYCLADKNANPIPHGFVHGIYKFISPRPPLPEITIKVVPPTIFNPSLIPCTSFNISVAIENSLYLHGFSLKLGYNGSVIECTAVEEGDLLKGFGTTTMTYLIKNDEGYTFVSANLTDPEAMANGNGILAKFTFHVLAIGNSVLHLYETEIRDTEGIPLSHDTSDGYFDNVLMPKLFVDPPVIVDPSMKPGDKVQVDIKVANVSDLYDFEFTMLYDTHVLNGLGVLVIPFGNETSFDLQFALNDTAGRIWVKVQYYPPAEPLTTMDPVSIATLFFQIQSYGATYLHFEEHSLSDSLGNEITHVAEDGYISILRRDVAVDSIVPEFNEAYKGWQIGITVVVKNLGDIAETFNVTLYVSGHLIDTQQVNNLASHANTSVLFTFNSNQVWVIPCHNYTLKAETSTLPYEIDTTNNVLEQGQIHIFMMGDINGDATVNYQDAILAGMAFGTKPGDLNWNPKADLNRDNFVNYLDVIILGGNFGASCPP